MNRLAGTAIAVAALISSSAALAQGACGPRDTMIDAARGQFGESLVAQGLTLQNRQVVELYVSQNGTWTMFLSPRENMACVVAVGDNWRQLKNFARPPAEALKPPKSTEPRKRRRPFPKPGRDT
ncbi:MAG: hypothetical protein QNJ92_10240 [Alphaproteobacteria bacterium]|nr:hypothetical protein [Alphaproteobacteria bacterium]